jgi:two-component system chemotaxis response regulator CheY
VPTRTVMVVEDDPDCLEVVAHALALDGYAVMTAVDGRDALRALEAGPAPDLILLDLMLPVMDGWQFLEEQRARPALAGIPVVLLSGERALRRRASELGVAGAIPKPIELDELVSTVRRVVGPP